MPNIGITAEQRTLAKVGTKTLLTHGTEHWRSSYQSDHTFALNIGTRASQPKWSLHKKAFISNT